ncbi:MAG: ankyrin repeat domain-containing protein [Alphaproteobacteria bacterium]|nr:ankyrin repeat domain-containing protein [Alphaproteobacteria bacterium]
MPANATSLENAFDRAQGGNAAIRKAFFDAIRAGDVAAVTGTLQNHAGAATWQEPFAPEDKPYAADDTPLMTAAHAKKADIVRILLQHGGEQTLDARNSRGYTALMYAAWQGAEGVAEVLLWHGANTWIKSEHDQDADMLARTRGHNDISRQIQNHRAKVDGPAAFMNGLSKDVPLPKPITVHKRPPPAA